MPKTITDQTSEALQKKISFAQIIRFSLVGGFTAATDYFLLYILVEYFSVNYLLATGIGFLVGSTLNYILSIMYVFEQGKYKSQAIEFIIFLIFTAVGLILNQLIMWCGVDLFAIDYLIVKGASLILVTLFNFLTKKFFVFSN